MGYTGSYFARLGVDFDKPRGRVDIWGICATAGLAASLSKSGMWLDALTYLARAVDCGVLRQANAQQALVVDMAARRLTEWHVLSVAAGQMAPDGYEPGQQVWDEVTHGLQALEYATWRPSEGARAYASSLSNALLALGRILRRRPHDVDLLVKCKRARIQIIERVAAVCGENI